MPNLTRLKRGRNVDKKCRAGCGSDELLGHILQKCHRTHHTRIARHDNIVTHVAKRLEENGWTVRNEARFKTSQGTQIPDLMIVRDQQPPILDAQVVEPFRPRDYCDDVTVCVTDDASSMDFRSWRPSSVT
ncbi:hypothetical protein HPB52_007316 [Rhipicephalus sanguineus]|uniref:Reverse transcriptase n=1 Tax=Rhipicephalus sanguineus TaxID=34632 RepID=A0A9D4Q1A7_RHISA|nr:hypothetical protein HPB52_007316 [Rhipicephalus sanguineus]